MNYAHHNTPLRLFSKVGRTTRYRWVRYSLCVVAVGGAMGVRWALDPIVASEAPFLMLFAAVMAAAVYGGLGPGLFATLLGATAEYLLTTFQNTGSYVTRMQLTLFLLEGGVLSVLAGRLHQAIRQAAIAEAVNLELEQHILEISDDERRRIGHDLHDGLGQQLTGIALLSKALQQRLNTVSSEDAKAADHIATLVSQTIGWTRDLARGLAPLAVTSADLTATLEEATVNSARLLGINHVFEHEGELPHCNAHTIQHLYRIVQEAISNSVKHGKATSVTVTLGVEDDAMSLAIWDDGIGISAKTLANPGLGLQIMRYRARMIGATIKIARVASKGGTMVKCVLPPPPAELST